ncbi:MAG: hypothetical protein AAF959_07565 [Cyanobacteria bacterium P01_D01_bin.56]
MKSPPSAPIIHFYIPPCFWPEKIPGNSQENWAGFGLGIYTWTIQTYLRLKESGLACELSHRLPERGIVLFHSNALRESQIEPGPARLLICIKAESPICSVAQLHIVQNPCEANSKLGLHFIPHWPQPGLLPRAADRGNRFETVAFFGHQDSLASYFRSPQWVTQLAELGLRWRPIVNTNSWNNYKTLNSHWNDYRSVDAIVALRQLRSRRVRYRSKPATKLYNAWLAGVPAILGKEAAYRRTGQIGLSYLEANSEAAVLTALKQLQTSSALRQSLVNAGHIQSIAYQPESIAQRWRHFLRAIALPAYNRWCNLNQTQQRVSLIRSVATSMCDRSLRRVTEFI